jgi:hypothetical protein
MIANQIVLAAAPTPPRIFSRFTGAIATISLRWVRLMSIGDASGLPPYLLYDIGLTPADIETARQTGRHTLPHSLRC